jgi:uncharacterized oxidoreductase
MLALRNTVIVTDRNADNLKLAQAQVPALHTLQSDASNSIAISNLVSEVTTRFPNLDVLINNAGIMRVVNLRAPNDADYLVQELETNLLDVVNMVQESLPHLEAQPEATMVNVTSDLTFAPLPACSVYSAAKADLYAYTQALRVQLRPTRVKVFSSCLPERRPTSIETSAKV